jgi:hypothetical protein
MNGTKFLAYVEQCLAPTLKRKERCISVSERRRPQPCCRDLWVWCSHDVPNLPAARRSFLPQIEDHRKRRDSGNWLWSRHGVCDFGLSGRSIVFPLIKLLGQRCANLLGPGRSTERLAQRCRVTWQIDFGRIEDFSYQLDLESMANRSQL